MKMDKEQLIEELKKLGWRYAYLGGHGDAEAVYETINGEGYVIGDIEKSSVLVPPECVWKEPIKQIDYYA